MVLETPPAVNDCGTDSNLMDSYDEYLDFKFDSRIPDFFKPILLRDARVSPILLKQPRDAG